MAASNANECSSATPTLNGVCAAALHEVAKSTVPNFSLSAARDGVATGEARRRVTKSTLNTRARAGARTVMGGPPAWAMTTVVGGEPCRRF